MGDWDGIRGHVDKSIYGRAGASGACHAVAVVYARLNSMIHAYGTAPTAGSY